MLDIMRRFVGLTLMIGIDALELNLYVVMLIRNIFAIRGAHINAFVKRCKMILIMHDLISCGCLIYIELR